MRGKNIFLHQMHFLILRILTAQQKLESLPFSNTVVSSKAVFQIGLRRDVIAKGVGETAVS